MSKNLEIKPVIKNKDMPNNLNLRKAYVKTAYITFVLLIFDQILKFLAENYLQKSIILNSLISLRYEKNYGIAWSIAVPQPYLIVANILLVMLLPILFLHYLDFRKKEAQLLAGMVFGGASGNLLDRILHGYVVDYLAIGWWPVFNLADAVLTTGIFLICLFYGKIRKGSL